MEAEKKQFQNMPQVAAESEDESKEPQPEAPTTQADLAAAYQKALTEKQKVEAEKQELYDRLLRKQAELENFRKRIQREKEESIQHANSELIRSLLPVLDGFDRALKQRDPSVPSQFYEGMELIQRQLLETLGRAGLTTVEAQGQVFDPEVHHAVETVESAEHSHHEVLEELQRGYKLKQRLLRPAVVKVAVQPQEDRDE